MLALQTISNFQIFPEHHYDPTSIMSNYSFADLRYAEERGLNFGEDQKLAEFAIQFSSEEYSRNNILGCGPYILDEWETGQYLVLRKSKNWWGEKYAAANVLFKAGPDRIIYPIIGDETVSLTALKDDQIDAMSINEPTTFVDLKENDEYKDKFHFLVAPIPLYYYIAMNNQSPFLDDPRERRAVALTLDVDRIIQDLMEGTAQRTIGPIHPGKVYYNKSIDPLKLNIDEAKRLLAEAGWKDTNNNGVVDANIDGKLTEMTLRFFVTQRQLGRKTALIHKELAAQAGIQIDIVTEPDFPTIRRDHLSNSDFELVAAGSRMSPADYDPYQNWHSNNFSTGSNYFGYADEVTDQIIESIRAEQDADKRNQLYLEFQARLHEQQGAIFLFSPSNLFIANKKFDAQAAERRPGFFESHMSLSQ